MGGFEVRLSSSLHGGQKQRVAIAGAPAESESRCVGLLGGWVYYDGWQAGRPAGWQAARSLQKKIGAHIHIGPRGGRQTQ